MTIAVDVPSVLSRDGLSREQLLHFAEHGWVLLERAIDPDLCQAIREADQRMIDEQTRGDIHAFDRGNSMKFREPHMYEPVYYELYKIPGLLAAARQLVGHNKIRYTQSIAVVTEPDHERHTHPEVVNDRRTWGWHRAMRPRDVLRPHETDAELIHSSLVGMGMYFVPAGPEHGVTALMDKSHRYEGGWEHPHQVYESVGDRFEVVQPASAEPGSIVMFAESLLHTRAPVMSEQRRFALMTFFAVPWFHRNGRAPDQADLADEELRNLFAPCLHYDPADDSEVG